MAQKPLHSLSHHVTPWSRGQRGQAVRGDTYTLQGQIIQYLQYLLEGFLTGLKTDLSGLAERHVRGHQQFEFVVEWPIYRSEL